MSERHDPRTALASEHHADEVQSITHGGNLHEAALRFGIPYADWLDLSTGINPHGYPVPPVPSDAWRRLPDDGDGFTACAARYYGAPDASHVLAVAGSQAAIRALPTLLPRATVAIAPLTYGEYAPAFARAGHVVAPLDVACAALPDDVTHAVVVNPNNPTAAYLGASQLLDWHAQLAARGGTLIVDEAFADAFGETFADDAGHASNTDASPPSRQTQHDAALAVVPSRSLAAHVAHLNLVVLRSPGKFFGLAGVRAGFVLAAPVLLAQLHATLGAWTVSGPARHAVRAAFTDRAWQHDMRKRLAVEGARLHASLEQHRLQPRSTPLFAWTDDARALALHHALAQRGIWTRLFATHASVRFGLPATEVEWSRLERALAESIASLSQHGAQR
ncbi:threonine-phosphate decarboxylase [Paraburkholderia phosphatilytica]|uniref:threonine-phosphate decarboxylase n=1 Tax=Paraburkholderia phosphatilytica TaxID=2282883 RepID=UPI000E498009|nr:threonine-phosphate decarboxylase [Paraburkholderia phosphatilytica]